ncbi:MAG TPA: FISUMP domain-containing protein, partial [Bacteroidales bacterium]|nr:FISUMP domain-containing protein [Bacteroidales bacterium]
MKKTIISLFALVFIYFCTPTPQEAPNTFTDSRDSKVYKTVTIGNQVWMAENLAYLP